MDNALTKLNEHFLSCNICTEIFKDPCTIDCQHTFCKVCLTKYTETRREAITAKSILCPNCRQMTKVPRPQEPVDQWCQQFRPSFLIQGLLDTFTSEGSADTVGHHCFACQQIGKTTHAKSVCEDCNIILCEACAKIHQATPTLTDHMISPRGVGSISKLKKRKVMCKEHNSLIEFCCKDCQKAVCQMCCIVYHRKCQSVVTLESMIPEMKQALQQKSDQMNSLIQQKANTLKSRRSEFKEITQLQSSLQSEIRRVRQQALDVVRRKEKKLLDELDTLTEKQTGRLRYQIKSGEIGFQTCQQYTESIQQVLQSQSPMDLYDVYQLCQSGEITAEIQRNEEQEDKAETVLFEKHLDVDDFEKTFQIGSLKNGEDKPHLQDAPKLLSKVSTGTTVSKLLSRVSTGITVSKLLSKVRTEATVPQLLSTVSTRTMVPKLLSTVSTGTKNDTDCQHPTDIEVLNIGGITTLVVTDYYNDSVKSCYTIEGQPHCTSLKLCEAPWRLTKMSQDRVAVSHFLHNSIELIKLTPDPVLVSSIKTKKTYTCLTALNDTTLVAGCGSPPSIDVLGLLLQRVLKSVIIPGTGQQVIQQPWYMCTTRQGLIVVTDGGSGCITYVTQQGEVVYSYKLPGFGVTSTDTGYIIVADHYGNKIVQLTERGEYVRDLLTGQDGIVEPRGLSVRGNKLYVTEDGSEHIKVFQL